MEILTVLNTNPNLSIALGYFDGVHIGHKSVIQNAVAYARQNHKKSAVITFDNHPCCYIWGVCPKYILTNKLREEKLEELGVDYVYELDFESLSKFSAESYVKDILVKYFSPVSISVGWNHNFGYNKSGNAEYLKKCSSMYGYDFFELPPERYNGEIISSTAIRNYLTEGKIFEANSMLGYKFSIKGTVIEGNKIGRTIGFKTANIGYPEELIEIPYGVYDVDVMLNNKTYKAIANFGIRPTFNGSKAILEVHLLNFNEDIYGQVIDVKFNKMLRKEQKFSNIEELKNQIALDILKITK